MGWVGPLFGGVLGDAGICLEEKSHFGEHEWLWFCGGIPSTSESWDRVASMIRKLMGARH